MNISDIDFANINHTEASSLLMTRIGYPVEIYGVTPLGIEYSIIFPCGSKCFAIANPTTGDMTSDDQKSINHLVGDYSLTMRGTK